MKSIRIEPLPIDYQELISSLKQHLTQSEKDLVDFEHRHYNGIREKAVIYCLRHAIDLAKGCIETALANLPDSLTTLCRALLETLFWARYVTLSEENTREFTDSTINEMKRVTRKSLRAGHARVRDIRTNEDKSTEFLKSKLMQEIKKRISIEKAAELGGLEFIYNTIYSFISMIAHGRAFDLKIRSDIQGELYASISAALGALQCIELITFDWITSREQTPSETLIHLLA